MKKIIYIVSLFVVSMSDAQVGINTKKPPLQTLDINGSLRVTEIPEGNANTIPLTWIPLRDARNNPIEDSKSGKIVVGLSANDIPFEVLNYTFNIQTPQEDFVNDVDLGVSSNDYTLVLLDYALLDSNGESVFLHAPLSNGAKSYMGTDALGSGGEDRGDVIWYNGSKAQKANDLYLVSTAPIVLTYPKNNSWHFYADYPKVGPVSFDYEKTKDGRLKVRKTKSTALDDSRTHKWRVKFLKIRNTYIETEERTL